MLSEKKIMPRKPVNLILACEKNLGIGLNGTLPWNLKTEMKYFASTTKNVPPHIIKNNGQNAVIMGRKTWESIPKKFRPLKGRHNVVISKTLKNNFDDDQNNDQDNNDKENLGCVIETDLEQAIENLQGLSDIFKIWIIGGKGIYDQAIREGLCDEIYLTNFWGWGKLLL